MRTETTIVWFRRDLRLADHPALSDGAARGIVVPCFVWDPKAEAPWQPGAASRWWLHQSLRALAAALAKQRSRLVIRRGDTLQQLQELIRECKATTVHWNRLYEPGLRERDDRVQHRLESQGTRVRTFATALLLEPSALRNRAGDPYRVFTPFWKACREQVDDSLPLASPTGLRSPRSWPASLRLESLRLEPRFDWAGGLRQTWTPGEKGAQQLLAKFAGDAGDAVAAYERQRDRPAVAGTSNLSAHLHHGELSPRQVWHAVQRRTAVGRKRATAADAFLRQLGWREFAQHLLAHFPETPQQPLRDNFRKFPWRRSASQLRAWQRGRTGFPLVDAGMRQLWETGWMHNRVRMVVASILVKDLLIDWREGARWFWDTLVDADLANNTMGWQWVAGCGADAAPYFRIFHPTLQARRFDPGGDYVRRWVPELRQLPRASIHDPSRARPSVLADAGVTLGRTYPLPIVSHAEARLRALDAFARMRDASD